jgi:AraC-like DNA-binding protein
MRVTLFDLLVVIGISQGLFTSFLLFSKKNDRQRNRLLAVILLTFILLSFKIIVHTVGLWGIPGFRYFPLAVDLTIQPLIYLYICASVDRKFNFTRKHLIHFLPFAVFLAHAVVVYICVQHAATVADQDAIANELYFNEVKWFEDVVSVFSAWIYCVRSYLVIKNYRNWLNDNISDMSFPTYTWLRNVLVLFSGLMLILTINLSLDRFGFGITNFYHWQLFYLTMAAIIYYMGVQGYRQEFSPPVLRPGSKPEATTIDQRLLSDARDLIVKSLQQDKVFRDSEISLHRLADKTGLPVNVVSHTINKVLGKNFRNLINEYRIAEVKEKLSDPRFDHLSILGIALECGFNSEASFYRVFKQVVGMSPREFAEIQRNK